MEEEEEGNNAVARDDTNGHGDGSSWNESSYGNNYHEEKAQMITVWHVLSALPIEVAFGLFSLLCAWSLTSLTCFHAMIITMAQTTNERVRGVYEYGGLMNMADEGCWRNWKKALCDAIPESRIPGDFSEIVTRQESGGVGQDGESESSPLVEEGIWPGWQYSHSFTSLVSSVPTKTNAPKNSSGNGA